MSVTVAGSVLYVFAISGHTYLPFRFPAIDFRWDNPAVIVVPAPAVLWQSDRSKRILELTHDKRYLVNGIDSDITVRLNASVTGNPPYAIFASGYR